MEILLEISAIIGSTGVTNFLIYGVKPNKTIHDICKNFADLDKDAQKAEDLIGRLNNNFLIICLFGILSIPSICLFVVFIRAEYIERKCSKCKIILYVFIIFLLSLFILYTLYCPLPKKFH